MGLEPELLRWGLKQFSGPLTAQVY